MGAWGEVVRGRRGGSLQENLTQWYDEGVSVTSTSHIMVEEGGWEVEVGWGDRVQPLYLTHCDEGTSLTWTWDIMLCIVIGRFSLVRDANSFTRIITKLIQFLDNANYSFV